MAIAFPPFPVSPCLVPLSPCPLGMPKRVSRMLDLLSVKVNHFSYVFENEVFANGSRTLITRLFRAIRLRDQISLGKSSIVLAFGESRPGLGCGERKRKTLPSVMPESVLLTEAEVRRRGSNGSRNCPEGRSRWFSDSGWRRLPPSSVPS